MVEKYIAVENVAGYSVGDEVDYDQAKKWERMYKVPPVVTEDVFNKKVDVQKNSTPEEVQDNFNARIKELEKINKDDLLKLGSRVGLGVESSMPKKKILDVILKYEENYGQIEENVEEVQEEKSESVSEEVQN